MVTIDLRGQYKHLYKPSAKAVQVVDVPELNFLMIDGEIEPGQAPGTSAGFEQNVQALYGAAYTLKFTSKLSKTNPIDYPVMALEGLWWVNTGDFDITQKDNWSYTLMILQPDHISAGLLQDAIAQVRKKRGDNPALDRLRLERFCEGLCLQIMHIGPYAEEMATIQRIQAFAAENGYRRRGRHHEIYMGDPRRGDPAKMQTVLREAVEKV